MSDRPAGIAAYLAFPGHDLFQHYTALDYGGLGLIFLPAFRDAHLPKGGTSDFLVDLLDTSDGKVYRHPLYVAYEHDAKAGALDTDFSWREWFTTLQGYFYGSHHCPCHRKDYAREAGAVVEYTEAEKWADENGGRDGGYCSGDRFQIKSITCDGLPGLVLYSETMTEEELETILNPDQN